jgi:predicted nucleic acid-binding protein
MRLVLAAKADLIVTGDRALLSVGSHQGIEVATVSDALRRLETRGS